MGNVARREELATTAGRNAVSEREQRVLGIIETARAKRAKFRDERITMAHGAGGRATRSLVEGLLAPAFGIEVLGDAAAVGELALTTDAFVVKPLRFPGGSIGELAVNGTVNDLAVSGARALALTLSLVLEEGLAAGDDPHARRLGGRVLLSGSIGEHGTAIMLARGEFELDAAIESDTRSLWPAVDALLEAAGPSLRCMRDATRGGIASVLNEIARSSAVAMIVQERAVPVLPAVAGAAEILGIDPMYVANEGKLVAFVAPEAAEAALAALREVPGCEQAAEIGEVRTDPPGMVLVETSFGGRRVMDQLVGDPLPRIC